MGLELNIEMAIALMNNDLDKFMILEQQQKQYHLNSIIYSKKRRQTSEYQKFKKMVTKRDKCCKKCGSTENLEVHHIKKVSLFPNLIYEASNGLLLCFKCHRNLHKRIKNG